MEVRFYIIDQDGMAQYDFNRNNVDTLPRIGEKILYYSRIENDKEVYAKVVDVIHVYTDNYVKIIIEQYHKLNTNNTLSDDLNNEMKQYRVTVTNHNGSTRIMNMMGTSRKNIFKQLRQMIDNGDSFLNPEVEEC